MFTTYMGGVGNGVVNSGGEGGAGVDGPDNVWAAGDMGAEGAVFPLGGGIAGACAEVAGKGGGTIN